MVVNSHLVRRWYVSGGVLTVMKQGDRNGDGKWIAFSIALDISSVRPWVSWHNFWMTNLSVSARAPGHPSSLPPVSSMIAARLSACVDVFTSNIPIGQSRISIALNCYTSNLTTLTSLFLPKLVQDDSNQPKPCLDHRKNLILWRVPQMLSTTWHEKCNKGVVNASSTIAQMVCKGYIDMNICVNICIYCICTCGNVYVNMFAYKYIHKYIYMYIIAYVHVDTNVYVYMTYVSYVYIWHT